MYLEFSELWLAWLQDEIKLVNSDDERKRVNELFEQAVNDYLCKSIHSVKTFTDVNNLIYQR